MITNKQLKQASRQLFTYSARYQAPFYGREKSIQEMQKKAGELHAGDTLLLSQYLGTGKTFLVTYMINSGGLPIPRGVAFLTARGIAKDPSLMDAFPGDVLVVDECDIKTPFLEMQTALIELQKYLDRSGKSAIVIGDFSLRNQDLRQYLTKSDRIQEFEPLDSSFLCGVLDLRFTKFLDVDKNSFRLDEVIAPDLIDAFTGEWIWPVNNFRGIFSLLQNVVDDDRFVRFNSSPARLNLDMVMEFQLKHEGEEEEELDTNEQIDYLNMLKEYIRTYYPMGNGLTQGFQLNELYGITASCGLRINEDDFETDILEPLARAGFLHAAGVPTYNNGVFNRRPLPMVPSLRLLLSSQKHSG